MQKTKNKAQIFRALLEDARELILKSINKTNEMQKPTEDCFNLREESADLSIDAVNKIDKVLSEVKNEK